MGVLAVEMKLQPYMNAARARSPSICTISDLPFTGEACTSEERQTTLQMIELALGIVE